ncbi:MAG: hypothetical protein KGR16_05990 [Verrucomicrobia bacterium]|nr:hypothetical protein [Verrucomicrobiota bacterium]MDE3047009.1 hypothetical protein [Verrucomicrobiota bacterium]
MSSVRLGDRLSEYQVDGNTYAVIVVMNGISASEAQHRARIRAAELTVMQEPIQVKSFNRKIDEKFYLDRFAVCQASCDLFRYNR